MGLNTAAARVAAITGAVLITTAATVAAGAALTDITGGTVDLEPAPTVKEQLAAQGVQLRATGSTGANRAPLSFAIKPGKLDPTLLTGSVAFATGLELENKAGVKLTLTDATTDFATSTTTATLNGDTSAKVPLYTHRFADLALQPSPTNLKVGGIKLRLTAQLADKVNTAFGTQLTEGQEFLTGNAVANYKIGP